MRHSPYSKHYFDDILIIPNKLNSLSMPFCILLLVATSVYTCVFRISTFFTCGYLVSILFLIICGFILYYGVWMMGEAFIKTSHDSSTMIWNSFSEKTVFIDFLVVFISSFAFIYYYYIILYKIIQIFLNVINFRFPLFQDYFFISVLASLFVIPLASIRQDLLIFNVLAFIKFFLMITIFLIEIIELVHHERPEAFQITMLNFTWLGFFRVFSHITKCYCMHMLYYPIISQLKQSTSRRVKKMTLVSITLLIVITTLYAILQYISFGDSVSTTGTEFTIELYINSNQCKSSIITFCISVILMTICSLPMIFTAASKSVLCLIKANAPYPKEIWTFVVILIAMFAIFVGDLEGFPIKVVNFFMDFFTGFLSYAYPVILYLGTTEKAHWIHKIGCALMIVVGLIFSCGNIYDNFWN